MIILQAKLLWLLALFYNTVLPGCVVYECDHLRAEKKEKAPKVLFPCEHSYRLKSI
uniref:Uncharacterized protein n=1 Tax=Setaria viridis TaxID=4556 RepID=A0A4U6TAY6_SETVI|nr:hypothetical protein SEVIR_9G563866v2 [Setaria viridis]